MQRGGIRRCVCRSWGGWNVGARNTPHHPAQVAYLRVPRPACASRVGYLHTRPADYLSTIAMTQRHWVQNDRLMFVTTNLDHRRPLFNEITYARIAVDTIYSTQLRFPFFLHGFVVMPDHCHLLMTVPENGSISRTMHAYKRSVSFDMAQGSIWQKRFDCRLVRPGTYAAVLRYIHRNPVTAGLCKNPEDYVWSSASGRWDVIALDFGDSFA